MEDIILTNSAGNGNYFLRLLRSENEKMEILVKKAEYELENSGSLSEELSGKLRIVTGKARLLMRQKFRQFEDLCRKNLEGDGKDKFTVTPEDLAGYWDVVMLQITEIHNIFEQSSESTTE